MNWSYILGGLTAVVMILLRLLEISLALLIFQVLLFQALAKLRKLVQTLKKLHLVRNKSFRNKISDLFR